MSDGQSQRDPPLRWPGAALLVATTAGCGVFGWFAMWSTRIVTSDEGYLLLSLREWVDRGHLYNQVYSQYGPFYYVTFGLPARVLGTEWTIAAGRITNLSLWLATSFLLGLAAWRLTDRVSFGVAAQVGAFSLLTVLTNEPMHPGALLCILLSALVANVVCIRPRDARISDFITGCLLAGMVLTKVNVGGFAVLGIAFAAASTRRTRHSKLWRGLVDAAFVALGPVLLLSREVDSKRLAFAALYACAAAYVVITSRGADARTEPGRRFGFLAAGVGLAAVGLLTALVVTATGTSIGSLVDGIAIRPTEQPDIINIPIPLPWFSWLWVAGLPFVLIGMRHARWPQSRRALTFSGVVRVVGGLTLAASVFGERTADIFPPEGSRFVLLPLVALVVVPTLTRSPSRPGGLFARRALGALAVTQSLHAYPVPGSQVAWGLLLAGVCGVVAVSDGVTELVGANVLHAGNRPGVAVALAAAAAIAIPLVMPYGASRASYPGNQLVDWRLDYYSKLPLSLEGTGPLRMAAVENSITRRIATSVRRNCDTFIAFPAVLISYYVLSGVRPPTGLNAPIHDLLTDEEQRVVVEQLRREHGRVCLLLDPYDATVEPSGSTADASENRVHFRYVVPDGRLERYLEEPRWALVTSGDHYRILRKAST
jgi:hypothetical protein